MRKPVKLYDLSQPLFHNCPGWAEYKPARINHDYLSAVHGFNAEYLSCNTHTATHLDVPYHFFEDGKTVEQIPLDGYAGEAAFLDLRGLEPDTPIGVDLLEPLMAGIEGAEIAIINTGWWEKTAWTHEYVHAWPYLDGPGAELLAKGGVKAVGCDTISLGGWGSPEKGRPCHEVLLGAEIIIIEELRIPDELMDGRRLWVSAFPILMPGCGGAMVRAVGYEF